MTKRISKPTLNKEKAKQVILYLLNRCGSLSEKKLQTLLYFIDFDYYEMFGEHFVGFNYLKL